MICNRDLCTVNIRQPEDDELDDERQSLLTAIISSGKTDGHGTQMTERTLRNFAEDLRKAIQFKDSHRMGQGFGVSTDGTYNASEDYVSGDFRLMRGYDLTNASYPTSDQFISAIADGIITRVSVGFSGGKHICNICDTEWYRQSCYHWPGRTYTLVDKNGKERQVMCIVRIDDARLVEVSAVSKGSNPDAMITEKAERCFREGNLPDDVRDELTETYGMRFDAIQVRGTGGPTMEVKELQAELDAVKKERDEALAQIRDIEPLAECGKEARTAVAAEALNAYKVSRGDAVKEADVEHIEKRFASMTYRELVGELRYYEEQAPAKPKVESGSQTTQPDTSGNRGDEGDGKPKVRSIAPPHWG